MKTYQALYIFSNSMTDDAVQETLQTIRSEVEKAGGTVTSTELMGKRVFARPMQKMEAGQYAKLLIQMLPSAVDAFTARLRLNEKIFRMQLVELKISARTSAAKKAEAEAQSVAQPVTEDAVGGKLQ